MNNQARVIAGLARARAHGTKSGKPIGRPKAVFPQDQVRQLRAEGLSWRKIARKLRVGVGTVRRASLDPENQPRACQNPTEQIFMSDPKGTVSHCPSRHELRLIGKLKFGPWCRCCRGYGYLYRFIAGKPVPSCFKRIMCPKCKGSVKRTDRRVSR